MQHTVDLDQRIFSSIDANRRDVFGKTLLMRAALNNNSQDVQKLLAIGADPNTPDRYGDSILNFLCAQGQLEIVKLFLQGGANPNSRNQRFNDGGTPLMGAARWKRLEVIMELIEWNADPTIANNRGHIPLDFPIVRQVWKEFNKHRTAALQGIAELSRYYNLPEHLGLESYLYRRNF